MARSKKKTFPEPGEIKRLKGTLIAFVVEVEGERREISPDKVSVYTGDPYTIVDISFEYDEETNSCIDPITLG